MKNTCDGVLFWLHAWCRPRNVLKMKSLTCILLSILATVLSSYFTGQVFVRGAIFTKHYQWCSGKIDFVLKGCKERTENNLLINLN